MLMDGRAQATGIKRPSMDATALLVLNAYHDVVNFRLPEVVGGQLALPDGHQSAGPHRGAAVPERRRIEVTGRSLLLFALEPESTRSVALIRARAALRQVSETPATRPWRRAREVTSDPPKPPGQPPGARSGRTVPVEEPRLRSPSRHAIRRPSLCAPDRRQSGA